MTTYANIDRNTFGQFSRDIVDVDPILLEDLQAHLERHPEIAYVSVPQTYIGYGSSLVSDSNYATLQRDFEGVTHYFDSQLFVTRDTVFNNEEFMDVFFQIKNEYALYDETDHSEREYDTLLEHVFDEVRYELEDTLDIDQFSELLCEKDISVHEYAHIDNDGSTPYMAKDDLETLMTLLGIN